MSMIEDSGRFILFHATEHPDQTLFWGQPVDIHIDVGLALARKQEIKARVWDMANPEDPNIRPTGEVLTIKSLLCPLNTKRNKAQSRGVQAVAVDNSGTVPAGLPQDPATNREQGFSAHSTCTQALNHQRPQLHKGTKQKIDLLDTSSCPDLVTFMPNIESDEEMHIELHLVIMNRGCEIKDLRPEDAIQLVTGYSLAAIVKTCKIGDTAEQAYEIRGVKAFCPFGPVMVTPQILPDPGELSVKVVINGSESEIKAQGANLIQVQNSLVAVAKNGHLWDGSHMVIKKQTKAVMTHGPSVRIIRGDIVVFKASHGMGHLINSPYQER